MTGHPPVPPPPPSPPRRRRRRGWWKILVILGVMALFAWLGMVALSWMVTGPPVRVADGDWLDLTLAGDFPDAPPTRTGLGVLAPPTLSARQLQIVLRRAQTDDRIRGVLLRPDGFGGGWAQAAEVRHALEDLRAAGKQVVAYVEAPGAGSYYLASVAENIAMAPEGSFYALGISARMTYLRGTMEKLGMGGDYIAVGEFKSAPEQFERREPSEPSRRQTVAFVDDVYRTWLTQMAVGRGLTVERMTALVDGAPYEGEDALEAGLVDTLMDPIGLEDSLGGSLVDPLDYLAATRDPSGVRVALVQVSGTILSGRSADGSFGGPVAGSDTVVERLRWAAEDETVEAVVLRVDSPGGSAIASDVIYRELLRTRATKPVVVSMGDLAASGGYYVAMAGDELLAEPFTLTGSIGVYLGKFDRAGFYEKLGLSFDSVARGENANLFSDLQKFSEPQRERLASHLGSFYRRFVEHVAEHRGMDFGAADAVARGRVWSGSAALEAGLVDAIGGLQDAGAAARRLAGHDAEGPVRWVTYEPEPGLMERLVGSLFGETAAVVSRGPSLPLLGETLRELEPWCLTLDGSPQFHLPYVFHLR